MFFTHVYKIEKLFVYGWNGSTIIMKNTSPIDKIVIDLEQSNSMK